MPRKAPRRVETPAERAIADRVSRARTATPPRGAAWYEQCGELAKTTGVSVDVLLDEFDERAAAREYLGGVTRDDAERLAFDDLRERFVRQGELLHATTLPGGR